MLKTVHSPPKLPEGDQTVYKNHVLDHGRDQIRILHLLPGSWDDPLLATLSVADLEDNPHYEALSYVWGDPNLCLEVTIDGQEHLVTANLWAALRRLRVSNTERRLWVDAMCTNQSDVVERSCQVAMMGKIYSGSSLSLAWLGEFDEDAPHAIRSQVAVSEGRLTRAELTISRKSAENAMTYINKLSELSKEGHYTMDQDNVPSGWVAVTNDEIVALRTLLDLGWWKRIWTLQEMVLPTQINLMCGSLVFSNEKIMELLSSRCTSHGKRLGCCTEVHRQIPEILTVTQRLAVLFDPKSNVWAKTRHLSDLMMNFRHRQCSDPRDKVFGLMGLTDPYVQELVDYSLTKAVTYTRFVRYSIISRGSLLPLLRVPESNRDASLPSWVPDFQADVSENSSLKPGWTSGWGYYPFFNAGLRSVVDIEVGREAELKTRGIQVDKILAVGAATSGYGPDEPSAGHIFAQWQGMLEQRDGLDFDKYPRGGTYSGALWRTSIMDVWLTVENGEYKGIGRARPGHFRDVKNAWMHGDASNLPPSGRRFFISKQGLLGLGPEDTHPGDAVYVLSGGKMPFILRQTEEGDEKENYTYVGHAYVHGIMDGEAVHDNPEHVTIV